MDAREEKQYAMTTVLVRFLADNAAAIAASEMAAADARATALDPYGLGKPVLARLRALHTAYAPTVRGTAALIDQRSQGNQSAVDLLAELMQQVYELDKPMDVFRFLDPALFDGYKRARRVGRSGRSGKGPAALPGLPPNA